MAGAIAVFEDGKLVKLDAMPVVLVNGSGRSKSKRRVDAAGVAAVLRSLLPIDHAHLEKVGAMPGEGAVGAFSFGRGVGSIEGALAAFAVPLTTVPPGVWKNALRCPADKGKARARASELFPTMAQHWPQVKDDGKAEAALIGLYGLRVDATAIDW